tara:strand:+ start:2273 stop:3340 length:1068 start_codon:yes stop_codon:yes gene_type:complete
MSSIELSGITKRWEESIAVDNVSFRVEEGTFSVLLGPSGCGKSTTLRMIAGLEDVSEGKLAIGNADMTHAAPSERQLSMVFQSYALFPHLNTEENILFGLKVRKIPPAEQSARLTKVADLVGLSNLLDRKPSQLSGGQRQRVALARAIIAENSICLMDEPLSNLDAKLRHDMRIEIRALQQRLKMTVVYVTHDQAEAMSMADKVILIREGKIEQEGTPDVLYDKPATAFSAAFIGTPPMNLLNTISSNNGVVIESENQTPVLAGNISPVLLGIRPEHITISDNQGISAELISADYLGAETVVTARVGSQEALIRATGRISVPKPVAAYLTWHHEDVHVFNAESGKRDDNVKALPV